MSEVQKNPHTSSHGPLPKRHITGGWSAWTLQIIILIGAKNKKTVNKRGSKNNKVRNFFFKDIIPNLRLSYII
jgi:hypothetical protein